VKRVVGYVNSCVNVRVITSYCNEPPSRLSPGIHRALCWFQRSLWLCLW